MKFGFRFRLLMKERNNTLSLEGTTREEKNNRESRDSRDKKDLNDSSRFLFSLESIQRIFTKLFDIEIFPDEWIAYKPDFSASAGES